jgi:hypothetical protein
MVASENEHFSQIPQEGFVAALTFFHSFDSSSFLQIFMQIDKTTS